MNTSVPGPYISLNPPFSPTRACEVVNNIPPRKEKKRSHHSLRGEQTIWQFFLYVYFGLRSKGLAVDCSGYLSQITSSLRGLSEI
jgi:hypothetical protein